MSAREEIIADEGDVPYVYKDDKGLDTIGVGFLVDKTTTGRLPSEVRDFWLDFLLTKLRRDITAALPWWTAIPQAAQDVFLNVAYNSGLHGLQGFHNMLAAAQSRDWERAAVEVVNSTLAPARAKRLAAKFRGLL